MSWIDQKARAEKCREYVNRLVDMEQTGSLLGFWMLYAEYLRWCGEHYSTERGMFVRAIERTIERLSQIESLVAEINKSRELRFAHVGAQEFIAACVERDREDEAKARLFAMLGIQVNSKGTP